MSLWNWEIAVSPPGKSNMTDEQIAQRNRDNARHSTGPRSAAGKRRSSLNAYRNGLNGQIVCQSPEELAAFTGFCDAIRNELAPVGPIETFLAKSISENMFRLERARALENGVFATGYRDYVDEIESGHPEVDTALAASQTFVEQAHAFHLLTGYETKIQRNMEKHQAQLKALQAERKAAHEKAVEQATQFVELAEAMEGTYEPREDFTPASAHGGFVFSTAEIHSRRERVALLRAARIYHFDGKLPNPCPKPDGKTELRAA
jgi:hypothetical protein